MGWDSASSLNTGLMLYGEVIFSFCIIIVIYCSVPLCQIQTFVVSFQDIEDQVGVDILLAWEAGKLDCGMLDGTRKGRPKQSRIRCVISSSLVFILFWAEIGNECNVLNSCILLIAHNFRDVNEASWARGQVLWDRGRGPKKILRPSGHNVWGRGQTR